MHPSSRKKNRAAIYARYSGQEKIRAAIYARCASENSFQIESQLRSCKQACVEFGWQVVPDFVRSDIAKSGNTMADREALDALAIAACNQPRPFDCLVIDDMARLSRKLSHFVVLADVFTQHGVFLYFVGERLDSRADNFPGGAAIRSIFEMYARGLSLSTISKRLKRLLLPRADENTPER